MTGPNLRVQFTRGNWRVIGKPSEANGFGNLFSIHDVLGVALARRLVERGIGPKLAFERATIDWAHGGLCGELLDEREHGLTVYVFRPAEGRGEVCGLHPGAGLPFPDLFGSAWEPDAVVINLTALCRRAFESLGLSPRQVRQRTVTDSSNLEAAQGAGARAG